MENIHRDWTTAPRRCCKIRRQTMGCCPHRLATYIFVPHTRQRLLYLFRPCSKWDNVCKTTWNVVVFHYMNSGHGPIASSTPCLTICSYLNSRRRMRHIFFLWIIMCSSRSQMSLHFAVYKCCIL